MKTIDAYLKNEDGTIEPQQVYDDGESILNRFGEILEPTGNVESLIGWNHNNTKEYRNQIGTIYLIP